MGPLELFAAGRALPLSALARLDLLLAADLPDRLSVTFSPQAAAFLRPGGEVRVLAGGRLLFRGLVEWAGAPLDAGPGLPATVAFTARPEWVARARALPVEEEYREVTDSEVAARLADALGLASRIEPTDAVHRRLVRQGDPLEFLIRRGRASGRAAAIASGRLQFAAALRGSRFRDLTPGPGVRSLRVGRGPRGRRGSLTILGVLDLCPLDRLLLQACGGAGDGLYRVARSRTTWDGGRVSTELDFFESDGELPWGAWEEGEHAAAPLEAAP